MLVTPRITGRDDRDELELRRSGSLGNAGFVLTEKPP
jgi:hypothetical protein